MQLGRLQCSTTPLQGEHHHPRVCSNLGPLPSRGASAKSVPSFPCIGASSSHPLQLITRQRSPLSPTAALPDLLSNGIPSPSVLVDELEDVLEADNQDWLASALELLWEDLQSIAAGSPTIGGLLRLLIIYYLFFTRPNPFLAALDFYFLRPLADNTANKWRSADFALREKLGGGNFGAAFEGVKVERGDRTVSSRTKLTPEQKKRRVVLKRVARDGTTLRKNFLQAGTMAKGASESGQVESYICSKIKRNPWASKPCAQYLGYFVAEETDGAFSKGSQWLVWKFESDATLGNALDGQLGSFPACLEEYVLGRTSSTMQTEKRDTLIIKSILRQVLMGLKKLHDLGIVHRDVKPDNLLITTDGEVKIIDFGAAVDMCTGVNFNPLYGMLDPRYSPPEELVMPKNFPRAPSPFVATLLSPFAWVYGRPDLFDSYSVGVLLMQLAVPQLRTSANIKAFNNEMRQCDFDLSQWRDYRGSRIDFTLLDRNGKAGWDLATKLLKPRDKFNRGRLSVSQALAHRYFLPEF
mmetsp:Transcript_14186/g.38438  ORF Transcript_14186/g.38438 Transcript_14186/m.38438 type:complete len:524 (+) Transcript_14186:32-1603(+)|eukprot:CAMPEP_0202357058 /NCGR_PEP_ID=MMETSP1126-20121109/11246_1 /ASSEMBLY_ACC=CAM_ASM_000457 /TAXON_ID=3047 /ORGANISM="Dunaliella tertiolecta, Strain CCMP1320" /LENGTH=523 /DNA_ID=CAMNT_0048949881 /DNA_START=25 /DNA_END=1596 /DNA_ORIENTATION=-